MVVTGAGPGIMAAGLEGAGRDRSFGVNIRLPHEEGANAFIAQDPKLVEMRYFFTRKLMLIKESHAYAVLPGGFGTQDEASSCSRCSRRARPSRRRWSWSRRPGGPTGTRGCASWRTRPSPRVESRPTTAPVQGRQHHRRGQCRDPGLLPELPLVPLGGRPARAAPAHLRRRRPSWPTSPAVRRHRRAAGRSAPPIPTRPSADDHPELPRLALRFDRDHYARLRQLIDAVNENTG